MYTWYTGITSIFPDFHILKYSVYLLSPVVIICMPYRDVKINRCISKIILGKFLDASMLIFVRRCITNPFMSGLTFVYWYAGIFSSILRTF